MIVNHINLKKFIEGSITKRTCRWILKQQIWRHRLHVYNVNVCIITRVILCINTTKQSFKWFCAIKQSAVRHTSLFWWTVLLVWKSWIETHHICSEYNDGRSNTLNRSRSDCYWPPHSVGSREYPISGSPRAIALPQKGSRNLHSALRYQRIHGWLSQKPHLRHSLSRRTHPYCHKTIDMLYVCLHLKSKCR